MRLAHVLDPLAQWLLELQTVSRTQWLLRSVGAASSVLALVAALDGGLVANFGATMATLAVVATVLVQFRAPDSDLGLVTPAVILLYLLVQGEVPMLRAAEAGLALLLAHAAWALAATIPVYGLLEPSAWRLAGRSLLAVVALTLLASLVVVTLTGVRLGPWMMVPAVLSALALCAAVLPRQS